MFTNPFIACSKLSKNGPMALNDVYDNLSKEESVEEREVATTRKYIT